MSGGLFALFGALAGLAEAALLARSMRSRLNPLAFSVRLLLVAGVLLAAARTGHLLLAAAGWAVGFFVGALFAWRRLS